MEAPIQAIVAVIHTRMHPPGVLQQVTIRPDKVKDGIIRLGETPQDEYMGWVRLEDVEVVAVLGKAELTMMHVPGQPDKETWKCIPED